MSFLAAFGFVIAVAVWAAVSWTLRYRALDRIRMAETLREVPLGIDSTDPTGRLARWLYLAGFRTSSAPILFIGATAFGLGLGVIGAVAVSRFGLVDLMRRGFAYVPGGFGEGLAVIAEAAPWILLVNVALAPVLVVRAARRRRVRETEEDLPLLLELLASLAEGGLGFDAALAKVLHAQPRPRTLAAELRMFQAELQVGVGRVQALRRLARRLDVPSVSTFVSALIHAEQVGAGLAEILRHQAGDLRNVRRERVLLAAQALPVKLVFPLVLCFLPSVFITTLGPALYQLIKVLNLSTFRGSSFP
ncbi:MAG: type II secretion system F family protein [Nitrospira sp.]|nr:type II secretion system F family protein [Nitrospira sp.]